MSTQPPSAPTARAIGPCPTIIQIVGRPGTRSLRRTIAPPTTPYSQRTSTITLPIFFMELCPFVNLSIKICPLKSSGTLLSYFHETWYKTSDNVRTLIYMLWIYVPSGIFSLENVFALYENLKRCKYKYYQMICREQ